MAKNARLNITVMNSTKRRLQSYCEEHGDISMGDVVDAALKNFLDRKDRDHAAPDLVLDRMNQLLLSNMKIAQSLGIANDKLDEIIDDNDRSD